VLVAPGTCPHTRRDCGTGGTLRRWRTWVGLRGACEAQRRLSYASACLWGCLMQMAHCCRQRWLRCVCASVPPARSSRGHRRALGGMVDDEAKAASGAKGTLRALLGYAGCAKARLITADLPECRRRSRFDCSVRRQSANCIHVWTSMYAASRGRERQPGEINCWFGSCGIASVRKAVSGTLVVAICVRVIATVLVVVRRSTPCVSSSLYTVLALFQQHPRSS
jgi:hypothetical protein